MDKYWVIGAATIIAVCMIFVPVTGVEVSDTTAHTIDMVVTGLFGIAVGSGALK